MCTCKYMCTRIQSFLNTASYWSAAFLITECIVNMFPDQKNLHYKAPNWRPTDQIWCLGDSDWWGFFKSWIWRPWLTPEAIWVCYPWVWWLHCELLLFLFISISEHFFWDLAPTDLSLLSRTLFCCAGHFDILGDHHPNRLVGQPKWLRKTLHISKSPTPRQQLLPPVENHCIKSVFRCFKTDSFFRLFILNYSPLLPSIIFIYYKHLTSQMTRCTCARIKPKVQQMLDRVQVLFPSNWELLNFSVPQPLSLWDGENDSLCLTEFLWGLGALCKRLVYNARHGGSPQWLRLGTLDNLTWLLDVTVVEKHTHSVEIVLGILHLDLFAGWSGTVRYPVWCWAAPSQLCHHKGHQPIHSRPFHTPIRILLFAFSAGFNKLHEISNTLLYNRLCTGWSLPNHSVLSLFKMG